VGLVLDLAPFTTYSFRVSAVNPHGASPLSKISYYMLTLREGELINIDNRDLIRFRFRFRFRLG
jgi:hypothetical protein